MPKTQLLAKLLYQVGFLRIVELIQSTIAFVKVEKYRAQGINIRFIPQGGHAFELAGDLQRFSIHDTSHIKSDTFIECSGGVTIGRYFHTGRGLTIFSTNHNYKNPTSIPYDNSDIALPVIIDDFVWCGANVTILPGATIGEGAVIGAGSVVSGSIPPFAVACGNPARVIKYRDANHFQALKEAGHFS